MGSSNEMEQVDLIDRQAAIDALTHKWDGMVTSVFDVINSLPSAQPEKRTETHACDCIDRQAAIDALDGNVIVTSKESAQAVMDYIRGCADRIRSLPSAQPEVLACGEGELSAQSDIVRCNDCKHWKDSDGVYRRGIGAESKCPVNIRAVYEGNFYCADAERKTDG